MGNSAVLVASALAPISFYRDQRHQRHGHHHGDDLPDR